MQNKTIQVKINMTVDKIFLFCSRDINGRLLIDKQQFRVRKQPIDSHFACITKQMANNSVVHSLPFSSRMQQDTVNLTIVIAST